MPVSLSTVSVTAGAAATNAGKQVSSSLVGNSWNIIVFGLNTTAIASGQIVTAPPTRHQARITGLDRVADAVMRLRLTLLDDAGGSSSATRAASAPASS
jgi:hypothetical protein